MSIGRTHIPADWVRAIVDPGAFKHEQSCLAHAWTFLGFTGAIAGNGDWLRASIATRSVFVQRFGDELKGFENLCAHRFYPLRNADRGNGPITCDFHRWQYDQEGRAIGIPLCRDVFDAIPQDLGVRLKPIEIETCGTLIFGRFPGPGAGGTLRDFLGDGFPILEAMSRVKGRPQFIMHTIEANWRLCLHISLDDYHIVSVHPSTLGKHGYVHRRDISYVRFGLNGAYLATTQAQILEKMGAACRDGTFRPSHYCIFHIVPNMLAILFRSDGQAWHCLVQTYEPVQHDRSIMRAWLYPAPFATRQAWLRALTDPVRKPIVRYHVEKIFREDNATGERIQKVAHQIDTPPLLGALEERIDWFEQSYRHLLAAGSEQAGGAGWDLSSTAGKPEAQ